MEVDIYHRPNLSAIVICKKNEEPGNGFYDLAIRLGLFDNGDKEKFLYKELIGFIFVGKEIYENISTYY